MVQDSQTITEGLYWLDPDFFGVDDSHQYFEPTNKTLDLDDAEELYDLSLKYGLDWKWDVPKGRVKVV